MSEREVSPRIAAPSGTPRRRPRETPSDRARIGMVVASSYRIDEFLGRGAIGAVFAGTHLRLERPVAVKFVDPTLVDEPEIRARFKREAKIAAQIGSSHAVEVFDYGVGDDGAPYLVMERLVGEDLHQRLVRDGPIPVDRALRIAKQVCRALGAAHENGIVHRDLKPENVFLVERDGEREFVKVVDFGLSTFVQSDDTRLTRAGQSVGTPLYMAPEQAGASLFDARVDVYSLGVLIFEMTTGRLPFEAVTLQALLVALATGTPRSIRYYDKNLPLDLDELITRFIARDPTGRPKSAAAALAEIVALEERLAINLSSGKMLGASPASPSGFPKRELAVDGLPGKMHEAFASQVNSHLSNLRRTGRLSTSDADLVPETVPIPQMAQMEAAVRSTDPALRQSTKPALATVDTDPAPSSRGETRPMNRAEFERMIGGKVPERESPVPPPRAAGTPLTRMDTEPPPARPSDRKIPAPPPSVDEVEEDSSIFYGRRADGMVEQLSGSDPPPLRRSSSLRKSSPTLPTAPPTTQAGPPKALLWLALFVFFAVAALVTWKTLKG